MIVNASKYVYSAPATPLVVKNSSTVPMTESTQVSLMLMIRLLPICGMMLRSACGSTTCSMVCTCVMPMALAPSVCPGSTDSTPPRTVSAMYAPVLIDTITSAAGSIGR